MFYKNIFSRFLFRKNLFRRIQMRLGIMKRKLERDEIEDLHSLFSNANIEVFNIIDGGANIGFVTWQFLKYFQNATIYSFEPNPTVFETLENSYKNERNVVLHRKGIAEESGELLFNVNKNSGVSSFLKPNQYHSSNLAKRALPPIKVPVVRLEQFFRDNNIPLVDILKLDVEGFELNALKGAKSYLKEGKIKVITLEVNFIPVYEDQPLINHIINYLHGFEYSIYNIYGFYETPIKQAIFGNLTFLSKPFREELQKEYGEKKCGW